MSQKTSIRWGALALLVTLAILVPFLLYEAQITAWTRDFLNSERSVWLLSTVLGGLLASDVLLPVPSSLVSTAAGYLLGLWLGALVCWAGMAVGCLGGYFVGASAGRALTRRLVGDAELKRVSKAQSRFGDWMIIVFRAVPVLAEASVVFAGMIRMSFRRFFVLSSLSNLGIALTYAAVGAYSIQIESFLLAFAGAIAVPAAAMLLAHLKGA